MKMWPNPHRLFPAKEITFLTFEAFCSEMSLKR